MAGPQVDRGHRRARPVRLALRHRPLPPQQAVERRPLVRLTWNPLPGADSSLICLMAGPQVDRGHRRARPVRLALRHRPLPPQQAVERRPLVRLT
jgi:hypothetical protein